MSEQAGEKTEQPTPRRLEEAQKKGQLARSAEVQTVFVLMGGLAAFSFAGHEIWLQMLATLHTTLGHLHDTPVSGVTIQGQAVTGMLFVARCAGPIVFGTMLAGLLAGVIQNRFTTASEALRVDWARLNPVEGAQRLFSMRQAAPTALALLKFVTITLLSYTEIRNILYDPIFEHSVSLAHIANFFAQATLRIFLRIGLVMAVLAAADYGYQWWRTHRDLMMTREELKEEAKSSESNPLVKSARRRQRNISQRKMQAAVPTADVVVTNPTHFAVALRYDRKTMKAPKVVAKGIRLNAQRIKEIARQHQVPVLENKPLARMLFKYGKVGGEIPAQLYAAVAEVLAWVYRVNRYRYFAEQNQT
ncbi:MAG: EscU/YscU/HrcU family type III secretion system export apparatus switch protein [Verrucomicrobia bacterium]|nr:EscU/YscU/HrcU family type III secretion system export apparatus switch protein [Verrucomicrobiota bacterium]